MNDLSHRQTLTPYSPREIIALGNKAAPGNSVLEVIARRSGKTSLADELVDAVMSLCAALQVIDDLNDLQLDFEQGNITMPLTMAMLQIKSVGVDPWTVSKGDLLGVAYLAQVPRACCEVALLLLDEAATASQRADSSAVYDLARVWTRRTNERLRKLSNAGRLTSLTNE